MYVLLFFWKYRDSFITFGLQTKALIMLLFLIKDYRFTFKNKKAKNPEAVPIDKHRKGREIRSSLPASKLYYTDSENVYFMPSQVKECIAMYFSVMSY